MTAVVSALRAETAPLASRLRLRGEERLGPCRARRGWLGEEPVVLACTGEGGARARRAVDAVLDRFPVRRLIVAGVGGGLSPHLAPGTVLAARQVWEAGEALYPPDAGWLERVVAAGGVVEGTVVSLECILCTAASKAQVWSGLGSSGPATVDLESAACARAAAARGLRYLVLRAVCDTAEEDLPLDLNVCRDRSGGIRRSRVVGRALCRPGTIRPLWRLARRLRACAERLAPAIERGIRTGRAASAGA